MAANSDTSWGRFYEACFPAEKFFGQNFILEHWTTSIPQTNVYLIFLTKFLDFMAQKGPEN
jgi:hypothetical protein